jgi:hypothetical protein
MAGAAPLNRAIKSRCDGRAVIIVSPAAAQSAARLYWADGVDLDTSWYDGARQVNCISVRIFLASVGGWGVLGICASLAALFLAHPESSYV